MPHDTRIALFLIRELVKAVHTNDPDEFEGWLTGGVQDLWEPVAEEMLLEWLETLPDVGRAGQAAGLALGSEPIKKGGESLIPPPSSRNSHPPVGVLPLWPQEAKALL